MQLGETTRGCVLTVSAIGTSKVTTIEGLSAKGDHPVQQAWNEVDVSPVWLLPGRSDYDSCCASQTQS
jgi:xanthine dehydrogenase iron-sulfur cluster and FAD-binding subunit A